MKQFFFTLAASVLVLAATSIAMAQTYTPPIHGAELDKYTAHPKRLLVIQTKQGTIKIQMFEKIAPKHVAHFTELAKQGFYDGTTFHRVIPGFMIQGGDPNSKDDDLSNDGTGQPGQPTVQAEFSDVPHLRGIVSTARRGNDVNSATSQFFIMHKDGTFLDKQYTVWGQVVEGMDVVDKIANLQRNANDNPGKAAQMVKVTVEEN